MYSVPFERKTKIVQGSKLHHPPRTYFHCCTRQDGARGTPELGVDRQRSSRLMPVGLFCSQLLFQFLFIHDILNRLHPVRKSCGHRKEVLRCGLWQIRNIQEEKKTLPKPLEKMLGYAALTSYPQFQSTAV